MSSTIIHVPATYIDGVFKPDTQVSIPENARVLLTVEAVERGRSPAEAFASFKERVLKRPIDTGGERFNRDDLYEGH